MEKLFTKESVSEILSESIPTEKQFKKIFPEAFQIMGEWRLSESDLNRYIEAHKHPKEFIRTELDFLHMTPEYEAADETDKMFLESAITIKWYNKKSLIEKLANLILLHPQDISKDFMFALKKEWDIKYDMPYPAGLYPSVKKIDIELNYI